MFLEDKIDLLVLYLIAQPFENVARPFLEKLLKVISDIGHTFQIWCSHVFALHQSYMIFIYMFYEHYTEHERMKES